MTNDALLKRPCLAQSEPAGAERERDEIFFLLNTQRRNGENWIIRRSKALVLTAVFLVRAAPPFRLMAARGPRRLSRFRRTGFCSVIVTPNYPKLRSLVKLVINHMRSLHMRLTAHIWSTAGPESSRLPQPPFQGPRRGPPSRVQSKGY